MRGKQTNSKDFTSKSKTIHKNIYDYSLVNYKNSLTKVQIICNIHGVFTQLPYNHLNGSGCPDCALNYKSINQSKGTDAFIKKCTLVHGDRYDYSLVDYKNNKTKVTIICNKHGVFNQNPSHHQNGRGCPKCSGNIVTPNTFIEKSNSVHDFKYDYSLVDYKNNKTKVIIICDKHGEFKQSPTHHTNGSGCPKCRMSKGEKKILKILEDKGIDYIHQHTFDECKDKRKLPFDFYLPDYKICIEYDGEQHTMVNEFFGGVDGFNDRVHKDKIKTDYCLNTNIELIRITKNDNMNNKLKTILK